MNSYSDIFLRILYKNIANFFPKHPCKNLNMFVILIKRQKHAKQFAGIAQSVEQRTENPRVTSSSLVPGIKFQPLR